MALMSFCGWVERFLQAVAEKANGGTQHERSQHAAGHHDAGDTRADDVADASNAGSVSSAGVAPLNQFNG